MTPEVLIYGTGEVGGIRLKDTVWLEKTGDQKVNGLDMLGIIVANGIDGDQADGILGLGPLKSDSSRTNFVSALKKEGLIDHEMFSINFKMEGKQSKMIFGDIDMKIVSNLNDIIWIPVLDKSNSDYWKLPLSSVQYGSKKLETQAKYGVIDTGSSTMAFSELNFLYLMKEILDSGLE